MNTKISQEDKVFLFNAMFANEYDELIQLDLLSGDASTVYATDPVWYRSVGIRFDFSSIMRRYILDISVDPHPEAILEKLRIESIGTALEKKHIYEIYFTARDSSGAFLLKAVSFYRVGMTQALMTIKDITEAFHRMSAHMQQLEEALKEATTQMEERNAFLTLMSRNLRSPLHSIMGLTQIAENANDLASVDAYLQKISMSGTYMSETIDDILDLRRISRGEIDLHPERIVIGDLIGQLNRLVEQTVSEKQLLFTQDIESAARTAVMADVHSLKQIILKLILCSASYTARGGRVNLKLREIYRTDDHVTLEIAVDSRGIILDQERLATLFQPYDHFREHIDADLSTLDISLIILKSYALAMGAKTLVAESDEARGTRISVTLSLPLAEDQQKETDQPSRDCLPDFTGRRVLLVDDNSINLEVSQKILESRGIIVTTAVDGQAALDRYREVNGQFDLILMDILMPVMDGLEATRRIRSMKDIPASGQLPIIAMTANAFREDFEESLRSGIDAHLVKPIDPYRLFHIMALLLHMEQ